MEEPPWIVGMTPAPFTAPGIENPNVPGQRIMDSSPLRRRPPTCHEAARRSLGNGAPLSASL